MKMEFKNFSYELKDITEDGKISGYASTFGNVDHGNDVVEKGAFKKTIQETKGVWPVLHNHNPPKRLGFNAEAKEDSKGLFFTEKLNLASQLAREELSAAKLAKEMGAPFAFSIGYSTIKADYTEENNERIRHLKELKMWEHSHVTFPMNDQALMKSMREWCGISEKVGLNTGVMQFLKYMSDQGYTEKEILTALHGAADDQIDPKSILQSFDTGIKIFN